MRPLRARRVLESCLYVDDLPRAARFYQKVLGLEPISQLPGRHAFFRCGDGVVLLFDPRATADPDGAVPAHGAHGPGHLAFAAAEGELAGWRRQLAEHGVAVEAEVDWPQGGHSLYFRDPAGNSLELPTPPTCKLAP